MQLSHVIPFPGGRPVDPPEQALVEAGGRCARRAVRRRPPRRRPAGGCKRWAVAGVRGGRARCWGRAGGSGRLRPAVGQRHPPNYPPPGGRCRHRGPGIRSQSPRWGRAIAGSRRGLDCRDADGGQVAVTGDAGPLCTGPVGGTGRRRSRPLRSRIKPGWSTSRHHLPRRRGVILARW